MLTYTWAGNAASGNAYRVRPIGALGGTCSFEPANPRPAAAPAAAARCASASMNVLNFFNTFDGLPDTVDNCTLGVGGAADRLPRRRRRDRVRPPVAEDGGRDPRHRAPTCSALIEIENDGYGPTARSSSWSTS